MNLSIIIRHKAISQKMAIQRKEPQLVEAHKFPKIAALRALPKLAPQLQCFLCLTHKVKSNQGSAAPQDKLKISNILIFKGCIAFLNADFEE